MTASDWFVLAFLGPLLITGLWVIATGVWRTGRDVSNAARWFTGERGVPGYHAFLGPATISMTTGWLGTVATEIQQGMDSPPPWMDLFIGVCFGVCFAFLLLGFWLWTVKWPRILVPPQFRER